MKTGGQGAASPNRNVTRALGAIFAVSGASGLIYEVAWMRTLRLLVGSTTLSHTIVLAAFMTGLALGAWLAGRRIDKAARPLRVYAWLEASIGLYGLSFPLLARVIVPPLGALYRACEESPTAFALGELLLLGPLVLPGAALMGATLPALGRVVAREDVAREGGWLYAVNTLGAAAGAAIAGFLLLPLLGLEATILAATATNGVLSAIAFSMDKRLESAPPTQEEPAEEKTGAPRLATLAVLVSALGGMTLQIAWTKLFVISVGSSTFAFTCVVAVYILGIGAGAALSIRALARKTAPSVLLALASLGAALAASATVPFFAWFPLEVAAIIKSVKSIPFILLLETVTVGVALLPATVLLGSVFPLGVAVAGGSPAHGGRALARISVASSLGSIAGALVGGLLLVRVLGLTGALRAGALLAGAAGIFGLLASSLPRTWLLAAAGVVAIALSLPGPDARLLDSGAFLYGKDRMAEAEKGISAPILRRAAKLVHHEEGEDLVAAVYTTGTDDVLVTNGKIDASSHYDAETQTLIGHVPILLHGPGVKRVLVIGLGSGMTAGAVLAYPEVERLDVIEISRTVERTVRHSSVFMDLAHHALDNSRTRLLIADGRTHIRHASETYDVIVSEPTNPWIAGVGDLYTKENFEHAKERLAPGGVFAQWLQGYSTTPELYCTIVKTFTEVFPNAQIWRFAEGEDSLLVARADGRDIALRFSDVKELVRATPGLREALEAGGLDRPEGLAWYFSLDAAGTRAIAANGLTTNTDDSGFLEHRAPFALFEVAHPLDTESAFALQRAALSPFPELPPLESSRIREALPHYHKGVRLKSVHDAEARLQALLLSEAEKEIRKAYEIAPAEPLVRRQLASVLAYRIATKNMPADFLGPAVEEIASLDPRSTVVLGIEGLAAVKVGRMDIAERQFRRLIELRPGSDVGRIWYAQTLSARKDHATALSVLEPVHEESPELLTARGLALAGLGRVAEAKAQLERAVALDPLTLHALATLTRIRARDGDLAGARAAAEQAARVGSEEAAGAWLDVAVASFKKGDRAQAKECCQRALELAPGDQRARSLLDELGRGAPAPE